ncbi:MAG: zinc-binding dehydrogenase [Candidatus Promineifilaceae bacterium]|nr:zinc-binding dehydrogenase [Candidatus Promineifilaceae bacterium]
MSTMLAAILREHGERDAIRLEEIPRPLPGPGEVRLRVQACALNWLDVGVRRGPKFGAIPLPLIGGGDIAATVDDVGQGVETFTEGDEVVVYPLITCGHCEQCRAGEPTTCPEHQIIGEHVHGGLAAYTVVPAANLLPKPPSLSFVEAAALPVVGMTAYHMLVHVGQIRVGETILIMGAGGGVASLGIQLARLAGARVLATTSTAEKAEHARGLGADAVFNYRDRDWVRQVWEATDGRGVDLVQDNVGAATWPAALELLARNGRLVSCGSLSGARVELEIGQIYHRQLSILGSNGGTIDGLATVLSLAEQDKLRPVVDTVLPLTEIHEGHRLLEEGEHFGKVVIDLSDTA